MHILKMTNELWDDDTCQYVGRSRTALGFGNPWSHNNARQARFLTNTSGESLYRYREWLMTRLIPNYISGLGFISLDDWERLYLNHLINLADRIDKGEVTSLGCWCINVRNYLLVPEGCERCHAEILYKACLHLISHKKGAML